MNAQLELYAVVLQDAVACRTGVADCEVWRPLAMAWRSLGNVLTWVTVDGAQRFADMNGGNVTPLSEIFRDPGILPTHGPLQHSPDETGPLESGSRRQTTE